MQPDPFPLARAEPAGLVPDRVRHADAADVVDQAGAPQRAHLGLCKPEVPGRHRREVGDRRRVAQRVRRLEVDEVRDRQQRRVELLAGQHDRECRLGRDHRVPRLDVIETREQQIRLRAHERRQHRVELLARAPARELPRPVDAADAMRHLGELRQLRDA